MIYFNLFLGFLKVGLFSFGGAYAAIPLIRDVVHNYGWLSDEQISYMVAVSESTPGPIMVNMATYVGGVKAGVLGAMLATFAVVVPAFVIIILLTVMLKNAIKNSYIQAGLRGLKPCIIGIILYTGISMIISNMNYSEKKGFVDMTSTCLTVFLAFIYFLSKKVFKRGLSPIGLICISAVLGMIFFKS